MITRKIKIAAYFGVPLVLLIVIAFLGIINEMVSENLPGYNSADDSGLKGLAIALIYSPILYVGITIIHAPLIWLVFKNISKARIMMTRIVVFGSIITSIILAFILPKAGSTFFSIYLLFQFFLILIGIIWISINWILLRSSFKNSQA